MRTVTILLAVITVATELGIYSGQGWCHIATSQYCLQLSLLQLYIVTENKILEEVTILLAVITVATQI